MTHWADVVAEELLQVRPDAKQVFATAITPSGPIHVGNMREVLTTQAVFRAARDHNAEAELLYIADDYDPLRKVYPFLHADYEAHVGKPLRELPCPDGEGRPNGCGRHDSYSEHFLEPFLQNLKDLGIAPTVLSAYDMYHEGRYVEHTVKVLDRIDEVRQIIESVSKRQLPKRWAPFNPQCPKCRRVKGPEVTLYEYPELHYECKACGESGVLDVREPGIGKLPWRIDWPARWHFLGVTFEAFGKDHGAAGGSWDTGIPLVRTLFGGQEPHHVMYEFLNLKGKGAMHSSTGLAVSAEEVLRMTPPEVLRYLLVRQSPRKHIDFDPRLGVLGLVDEFDRLERIRFGAEENPGTFTEVERTYGLSCPGFVPDRLPNKVPYRHLVTVCQMAEDLEGVEQILRRSGELQGSLEEQDRALLAERVTHVRYWLAHFAPDDVRFQVQQEVPDYTPSEAEQAFLDAVVPVLEKTEWNGKEIHDAIYAALEPTGQKPGQAFRAVYQAILGQDRGPRAGFFLSSLEKEWVLARLGAVAGRTQAA